MSKKKMIFLEQWFDSLMGNELAGIGEKEMGAILYATAAYCFRGEKIDIGAVFGEEYGALNGVMGSLYPQIDNIAGYVPGGTVGGHIKYGEDEVYNLLKQGKSVKEVAECLGMDPAKSRSLYSNPGYKRFKKEQKEMLAKFSS